MPPSDWNDRLDPFDGEEPEEQKHIPQILPGRNDRTYPPVDTILDHLQDSEAKPSKWAQTYMTGEPAPPLTEAMLTETWHALKYNRTPREYSRRIR